MKRRILFSMLAALMVIVTACSGGTGAGGATSGTNGEGKTDGTGNGSGGTGQEQVELRIMWWGDQGRADRTNQVLELFQKKYPNIKVQGEFAPSSGYFDKLNTQLASGTPADVFFLGGNVVDYANKGVLLELDPYVGSELDLTDMDESMVEYGTLGGKLLHISAGANARGILINTKLFEQAGIPVPQDGWSWDDYAGISKDISEKLGDGVYGTYNFTVDGMDIGLKQNGAQLYNMTEGKPGFTEEQALSWFKYWEATTAGGGVVTPELAVSNPPSDPSKSLIITGKVAMSLIPSNQFAAYQGLTEDPLTMVQLPRGPKGTGVVFESSQGLSGYAKTEHPKEVAMLINFFINDPEAAKVLGNDRGVPVTSKNREALQAEASDADRIVYDYTSRVSEATKTEPFAVSYNPPGFAEFSKLAETTVQEIGFGRKKVEQAVADFYNGTLQIFAKNQ
ncbi:multiple sugar transport system substrate-binding protein [Paenibacillus algorifonticola]|uniref:Multiple sugar transport system substrate-binding protein n=1 Tax=Paenibacillus algorifonticola TaxID=684063 RepID=A0A1I2I1X6_9BACL|nr:extracellular solute-binding protein [Paenibacillus algorifonticola]SFF35678.1 multiple sugar transport system substrate-binding protein [Paenibacillus algorifonticola]